MIPICKYFFKNTKKFFRAYPYTSGAYYRSDGILTFNWQEIMT